MFMKKETPENGVHIEYHNHLGNLDPRGKTKYESNYKNGLLHGKYSISDGYWEVNHYLGRIVYECNYLNGLLDGTEIKWEGNFKFSEKNYKAGVLHGTFEYAEVLTSSENSYAQKTYICNFINGLEEGKSSSWHINGNKKSEGYYVNGKKEGKWSYWFPNGVTKDPSVQEWEDNMESEEAFPGSEDDYDEYIENRDSDQPLGPEFGWSDDDCNY